MDKQKCLHFSHVDQLANMSSVANMTAQPACASCQYLKPGSGTCPLTKQHKGNAIARASSSRCERGMHRLANHEKYKREYHIKWIHNQNYRTLAHLKAL